MIRARILMLIGFNDGWIESEGIAKQ